MNTINKILIFLTLVLAIAVGGYGYYLFEVKNTINKSVLDEEIKEKQVVRFDFTNDVLYEEFLTNINKAEVLGGVLSVVSVLNVEQQNVGNQKLWDSFSYYIEEDFIEKNTTEPTLYFLNKEEANGKYLFTGEPSRTDSQGGVFNTSLFVSDAGIVKKIPTVESLNSNNFTRIRIPRWSSNGTDYIYNIQTWTEEASQLFHGDIDGWEISTGYIDGENMSTTTHFATGFGPVWVSDGQYVLYMKEDGIYTKKYQRVKESSVEDEVNVLVPRYKFSPYHHMTASADGRYVAITSPVAIELGNSSVDIYKFYLDEKEKPHMELVYSIAMKENINPYWPLFSQGGRYISFQTREFLPNGSQDNNIVFFDLVKETYVKKFDFNDFNFDWSFNTDWMDSFDLSL